MNDGRLRALAEFGGALRRLRSLSGSPSLNQLVEHSAGLERPLHRSTISDKLNGKSLPDWDFVVSFVRACQAYAEKTGAPLDPDDADLSRWDGLHLRALVGVDEFRDEQRVDRAVRRETLRRTVRLGAPADGAASVPRQLPNAARTFSGREAELADLAAAARDPAEEAVVVTIDGMAGVGKTALAVWWGHRYAHWFPDGQIYQDLRGFDPTGAPTSPAEALRTLLEALATAPARIPSTLDAMVGLYRTLVAGRRILVILDNARDADQVRALLPGDPTPFVVVTSRHRLTSLVAVNGARPITLDPLSHAEARDLLTDRLGPARAHDGAAVDEIVDSCARLPLALSIVAARAVTNPTLTLTAMAAELRASRLDALDAGDPAADVRSAFTWSYGRLSAPAAQLFRRLGLHLGPDLDATVAASLVGRPAVTRELAELGGAHLVAEPVRGRYALHDLVRTYATELVQIHENEAGRQDAVGRMLDAYLRTAQAAASLLSPRREAVAAVSDAPFADAAEATAWFTVERPVLLRAVTVAAEAGLAERACQLAWIVSGLLDLGGRWHERTGVQRIALAAAQANGDRRWPARIHRDLTITLALQDEFDESLSHANRALALDAEFGDESGQARTHSAMCLLMERWNRHPEALGHAQQSLELFLRTDNQTAQAYAYNTLGWYQSLVGSYQEAAANCRRAVDRLGALGDRGGEATAWDSLGHAQHHLGDHAEAIRCYLRAIDLLRQVGNRYFEARTLHHLGDAHHAIGLDEDARESWQRCLSILDEVQPSESPAVQAKLAAIRPQGWQRGVRE
jgi:tetratricopeptide (TPR) repeat protein